MKKPKEVYSAFRDDFKDRVWNNEKKQQFRNWFKHEVNFIETFDKEGNSIFKLK